MSLDRAGSGRNPPGDFALIVELFVNGEPVKCEVDGESGPLPGIRP